MSSPSQTANLRLTILPAAELEGLRQAQTNNEVLRSHNLDLAEDNENLQQELAKERKVVALLDATSKEFARQEKELKAEKELTAAHIVDLVNQVANFHRGNAPLYNRIDQLEVLTDALNAKIAELSNEIKDLKQEVDRKRSVYPPL